SVQGFDQKFRWTVAEKPAVGKPVIQNGARLVIVDIEVRSETVEVLRSRNVVGVAFVIRHINAVASRVVLFDPVRYGGIKTTLPVSFPLLSTGNHTVTAVTGTQRQTEYRCQANRPGQRHSGTTPPW